MERNVGPVPRVQGSWVKDSVLQLRFAAADAVSEEVLNELFKRAGFFAITVQCRRHPNGVTCECLFSEERDAKGAEVLIAR